MGGSPTFCSFSPAVIHSFKEHILGSFDAHCPCTSEIVMLDLELSPNQHSSFILGSVTQLALQSKEGWDVSGGGKDQTFKTLGYVYIQTLLILSKAMFIKHL